MKRMCILLAFLLVFQLILPAFQLHGGASEASVIRSVSVVDATGNVYTEDKNSEPIIRVEWSTEDVDVTSDETFTASVPSTVVIKQTQTGTLTTNDTIIGSFEVVADSETIKIQFNESMKGYDSVNGVFTIAAVRKEKQVEDEEAVEQNKVKSNVNAEIEENILTNFEMEFEKNNESQEEVDHETLIGIKYKWALENGHSYKEGALFKFYLPQELKVYNPVDREEIYFENEIIGHFTVNMDGTAEIEFTDVITQYSNVNGEVEVWTEIHEDTIIDNGGITVTPIEGKNSVTIPISYNPIGPSIEKKGVPDRTYNGETITWTVDFNKSLESLTDAKLVDLIQNGQKLKEGSIHLYRLKTAWNGKVVVGEEMSISKSGSEDFTLELGNINSAYRVTYETEITDADETNFTNTATLSSENKEDISATAEVTIQRGSPLEKEAKNYNKAEQSIEWEIRYNYNEKTIVKADAILKDFFTDSQELIESSVTVKEIGIDPKTGKVNGENDFINFTVTELVKEGKNGFEISFNQDVKKAYKITYKTKAKDRVYENTEIKNEVAAGIYKTGEIGQQIGPQILFKSHGNPDYAKKEIEWTIQANSDQHKMTDVIIEDTFTNAGLTYSKDTITVTEGGVQLSSDEYTFTENPDKSGFKINFNKVIEKEIIIKYNTSFDYEVRKDKGKNYLENVAYMTWKDTVGQEKNLTAKAAFTPDSYTQSNGFKNGSYNAVTKEVTWNVGINYNLQTLDKAIVEDTFDGNQKLLKDSLKVYKMSLTGGSNGVKLGEAVEGKDYEVMYPEGKSFQVKFLNSISTPYKIEYKTSVEGVDLVAKNYKNTATLLNNGEMQTELNATVSTPFGGKYIEKTGNQNGKVIDWKININFAESHVENAKVIDTLDEHQVLIRDSIKLYDAAVISNGTVEKGKEMENGTDYTVSFTEKPDSFTLEFSNSVTKPYILEYKTRIIAEAGTDVKNEVTFSGKNIQHQTSSSQTIKIQKTGGSGSGTGELGALTVLKKDASNGEPLVNAKFSLIDPESGSVLVTKVTDDDGIIFFDRLLYGNYILKEIEAPEGYIKASDQTIIIDKPFVTGDEGKQGNEVTVENKKIIHTVSLKKVDKEGNLLVKAIFSLERKEENVYQEVSKHTTDSNGLIVIENLEPGDYRFIEVKAPDGYQIDKTPIEFTIGKLDTEIKQLRALNLKAGSVVLKKYDKNNSSNLLEGAEFKLLDAQGNELQSGMKTDKNGEIIVSDLQPGTYQFVETKAPFGYKLDTTPQKFTLEAGKSDTIRIEFANELQLGGVQLMKMDFLDSTKLLENAKFSLQDPNGIELGQHMTDENGQFTVEELTPGDYQFIEVEAPVGYEIDNIPIKFTIEKGQTELLQLMVENKALGHVIITKVDDKTNKPLSGAEFSLENEVGHVLIEKLVSDEKGIIEIKNIPFGNYKLVETKAPQGYKKQSEAVEFEIDTDQKDTLQITVKNVKVSTGGGGGGGVPSSPENPSDPGKPTDSPENPSDPGKPTDSSENPSEPGKPTDSSENPSEPGKPTDSPENPTAPTSGSEDSNKPSIPKVEVDEGSLPVDPSVNQGEFNNLKGLKTDAVKKDGGNNLSVLPQTGEHKYIYMILIGLLFMIMGGYVLLRQSKQET